MGGNYAPDEFTENDVLQCLDMAGLRYKIGRRYILSQCPTHDDTHPSVQIYKDDWFVNCHAGCGRYHITKAFPELRGINKSQFSKSVVRREVKMPEYRKYDLMEAWKQMPLIPRYHEFKSLPLEILDELGWRWDEAKDSYFIPYFSASKTSIPFAQWRHLKGERRFTFLKDAKPTCYGTWNLDNQKLFLVEGTSDAAVLEYCGIPWIAVPSASSGELVRAMAAYCNENDITIVFAADNDSAGLKLREALDEVTNYRVKQPPAKYKDWADFYEAEGLEAVSDYCIVELAPMMKSLDLENKEENISREKSDLGNVQIVFPEATPKRIIDEPPKSKELVG